MKTSDPIKHYIVGGSVRGYISRHRLESRAHAAADQDRRACHRLGGGAYSDVEVWARHESGKMTGPYMDEH